MKNKISTIAIICIAAIILTLQPCNDLYAQASFHSTSESSWQKLGAIHSNSGAQKHLIKVGTSHTYNTLKISVLDVPIELIDITIVYTNGEEKKIQVKSVLQANENREFKLGKERSIKSIELNYNTVPRNGKSATVILWGN